MIKCKCLSCNKDYLSKLNEDLEKRFKNKSKLSNNDINKFILLLRKGVYLMGTWMNGKSLKKQRYVKKKNFNGNLNMEDIIDADYMHAKTVCKDLDVIN